jgi:hypothetical protein
MSTLTVANIQTGSATTDLDISTGNTSGPAIVLYSNNSGIAIQSNSTNVLLSINATSNVVLSGTLIGTSGPATVANVSGTGQLITSGNVTPSIITSNTTAWNPDSTAIATVIRVQANAAGTANNTLIYEAYISGLTAGTNGEIYTISNIGSQKIQLRNEDSVNETTAGNRFSLPNHVWLYGYQSIQMIYDGIKSRWTPLTCLGASPALSLGYDYDNTVTLRSTYKSISKGFVLGGVSAPTTYFNTVDRTSYTSETTAAVAGASLPAQTAQFSGAGNAEKGFASGGASAPATPKTTTANKTTYSSETTAVVAGAALSAARLYAGAISNADKGFFAGGDQVPLFVATADRTTYSSETTAAVTGANLSGNRVQPAGAGNADKGFFSGGYTPTVVATADRTTYSSETTAAVSGANLTAAKRSVAATGNADKGFFSGGTPSTAAGSQVVTADRNFYATETTAAVTGANLSQARQSFAAQGDNEKGFFAGGTAAPLTPNGVATADKTTYSTETTAAVTGANLSAARFYTAAF